MRWLAACALAACSSREMIPPPPLRCDPPRPPEQLDQWVWQHTSPVLDRAEQHDQAEREEATDRAVAAGRAEDPPACLGKWTTPLQVVMLDLYAATDCAPGARHRLGVLLDGAVVASVDVPCGSSFRAPPRSYEPPRFDVPPGVHRIRIREATAGVSAVRDYVFPDSDGRLLSDTLRVWAEEREFRLDDLTANLSML